LWPVPAKEIGVLNTSGAGYRNHPKAAHTMHRSNNACLVGIAIAVILLLTAVYCMRAAAVPFSTESYPIQSLEGWTLVSDKTEPEQSAVSLPVKINVGADEKVYLRARLPQAFGQVQTICFLEPVAARPDSYRRRSRLPVGQRRS
jgi:hypothetical protein